MKITLESTMKIVTLKTGVGEVQARIWEGETASGIKVHAFITRLAVKNDSDLTQFQNELKEQRAPSADVAAIPLRLII